MSDPLMKVCTIAHVPPHLERAWLQHLRNFDILNPGCHFEVLADAPKQTFPEMIEALQINPGLKAVDVFKRRGPRDAGWSEELVKHIIAMLPDSKAEGLRILDASRRMVERFKR